MWTKTNKKTKNKKSARNFDQSSWTKARINRTDYTMISGIPPDSSLGLLALKSRQAALQQCLARFAAKKKQRPADLMTECCWLTRVNGLGSWATASCEFLEIGSPERRRCEPNERVAKRFEVLAADPRLCRFSFHPSRPPPCGAVCILQRFSIHTDTYQLGVFIFVFLWVKTYLDPGIL